MQFGHIKLSISLKADCRQLTLGMACGRGPARPRGCGVRKHAGRAEARQGRDNKPKPSRSAPPACILETI